MQQALARRLNLLAIKCKAACWSAFIRMSCVILPDLPIIKENDDDMKFQIKIDKLEIKVLLPIKSILAPITNILFVIV